LPIFGTMSHSLTSLKESWLSSVFFECQEKHMNLDICDAVLSLQ
jgi:hypothetical protein